MPQAVVKHNERMSLRINIEEKGLLMKAASLLHVNLTEFVLKNSISAAHRVIEENERIELSKRDSIEVMKLLDDPQKPNAKMLKAAFDLPKYTIK
ncbi:type II toxin-antitoxin system TacA family antitoxin [Caedibacter taeniospiralis]|uniref:type II toxin-antitoxin system TacA family antitoxin n=1 Tax=Caedibacter taeniospiralis TaxID=28907 RepID=UPI000C26FBDD|nr:DUF1778 domain-containing protein [Caedibacter taeniospiralis]